MRRWDCVESPVQTQNSRFRRLAQREVENASARVSELIQAFDVLEAHPLIGQPAPEDQRELIIGRGSHGYVALRRYVQELDTVSSSHCGVSARLGTSATDTNARNRVRIRRRHRARSDRQERRTCGNFKPLTGPAHWVRLIKQCFIYQNMQLSRVGQMRTTVRAEPEAPSVGTETVDLSLRLLEFLARSAEPVGVSDLAREFGSSKATVYRHLQTLAHNGFVRQEATTLRYAAGIKLFILGERLRERFDILPVARGHMTRLRDETGLAVTLSSLVDDEVVVLEVIQGSSLINFGTQPGTVLPLHASAHGKVALAFSPEDLLRRCLSRPLKPWTPQTICTRAALERAITQVRSRGWATAPSQVLEGINGLAAPVFNHSGGYAGAIAVAGTVQAVPGSPSAELIKAVTHAAAQISHKLGCPAR